MSEYSVPTADHSTSTRASNTRSSSAFTRFANYVAPSSSGSVGSSAGTGSLNSLTNSSQFHLTQASIASGSNSPGGANAAPGPSRLPRATDSLEALASADRLALSGGKADHQPSTSHKSSAHSSRSQSAFRTESNSSSPARGRREYHSSRSPSREHRNHSSEPNSNAGSPGPGPGSLHHHNSYHSQTQQQLSMPHWSIEALPPNVHPNYDPNASGFFPGAAGGFSFEQHPSSSAFRSAFLPSLAYSGSYSNPSGFSVAHMAAGAAGGSSFHINSPASAPRNESNFIGVGSTSPFADHSPSPARPQHVLRHHSYNDRALSAHGSRSESLTRGALDGKPSRSLRFAIPTAPREPRGVVALARPREGERGRVAVAGKTYLRVLKVPYGERSASPSARRDGSPAGLLGSLRTSALANRRSVSRGGGDHHAHSIDEDFEYRLGGDRDDIVETIDVRLGSRLSPAVHLFSDVSWGYSATANKLATSLTNGSIVLWDLIRDGGNKLETTKTEHDRAVNKVVFGGATGSWLMSGGQDGQMKLWDIRVAGGSSMVLKAASPVRQLAFSPSANQPFTLLACCSSGTLLRYDLRNTGRGGVSATDRIAGHVGACLALSWRDNLPGEKAEAGGRGEGGWVVTAGLDRQIKVWDFGQTNLAVKPARTLYTSQPIQSLAWHPTRPNELVSSPLPTLAQDALLDEAASSTGASEKAGPGTSVGSAGDGSGTRATLAPETHRNEIEIWDVTRPYYPKLSLRTDDAPAQIIFNDEGSVWAGAKASSSFAQYDLKADSYNLYEELPPPGAPWNAEGELAYIDDSRQSFARSVPEPAVPLDGTAIPQLVPASTLCSLYNPDPDFDPTQFGYLADNLDLGGGGKDFGDVCTHNAQVSQFAGRVDAAQLWMMLKLWLDDDDPDFCKPETPPLTPPLDEPGLAELASTVPASGTQSGLLKGDEFALPPPAMNALASVSTESIPMRNATSVPAAARRSFSSSIALRRSSTSSPIILPADTPKIPLDYFSEESAPSSGEVDARRGRRSRTRLGSNVTSTSTVATVSAGQSGGGIGCYGEDAIASTSSESEHELVHHFRSLAGGASVNPQQKLQRSLTNGSRISGRGRSATLLGELLPDIIAGASSASSSGMLADREPDLEEAFLHSRASSGSRLQSRRPSSSSGSDDGDSDAEDRLRASKLNALHASLATRARRASSNLSSERKSVVAAALAAAGAPLGTAGSVVPTTTGARDSRRSSADPINMSRRGSSQFNGGRGTVTARERQMTGGSIAPVATSTPPAAGPSTKELGRIQSLKSTEEATESIKSQVQVILANYADAGDSQLGAVAACVLRGRVTLPKLFVARVSTAYVALLRRLELHTAAARVAKHTEAEQLRAQSQTNVVWHTACGHCGKAIETAPYDLCLRCRRRTTQCAICHQPADKLFLFCATCGHGAHSACLADYAEGLSTVKQITEAAAAAGTSRDQLAQIAAASSHPSTPGFAGSVKRWMWNEATSQAASPADEFGPGGGLSSLWARGEHGEEPVALRSCPQGMCGHSSGCILSEVAL